MAEVCPGSGVTANELVTLAAQVEAGSDHPLAKAVTAYAQEQGNSAGDRPARLENLAGRGLRAVLSDGSTVLAGSLRLLEEEHIPADALARDGKRLASRGQTLLYFAKDGKALGVIGVADPIKATSPAAIETLRSQGIRTVLLTGDNRAAAEAIAKQAGVDEVIAEVLPEEKAGVVQKLQQQGQRVLMVGDGINDAPALTQADVGCAIGSGSDIAIESADLILMRSDLQDVPRAIRLSRLTIRNIRQNLFWAFCYNLICIPVACGVLYPVNGLLLTPMIAGAAMSLSSLCVVSNALRLRTKKL